MSNIVIRKSAVLDESAIKDLFLLCYGFKWCISELLDTLDNRYYLLFDDDELVAMTGLIYSEEYMALEVDWTCTHPDYRHKGYIQRLFSEMLKDIDENVYCSCWRLNNKDKPNLYSIMKIFGFEKVIEPEHSYQASHNCHCPNDCKFSLGNSCVCWTDLYLRKK